MDQGLVYAGLLNQPEVQFKDWQTLNQWQPGSGIIWVHLDINCQDARDWLLMHSQLNDYAIDALLTEETRPRMEPHKGSICMALRGINLNPGEDPEDMVAIRVYADAQRVITARRRRLHSIQTIMNLLGQEDAPTTTAGFINELINQLTARLEETIDSVEDQVDALEQALLDDVSHGLQQELSSLRRATVVLRRYLAPQREALSRLYLEKLDWYPEEEKLKLRDLSDRLIRNIEDLDTAREHAILAQEQIASRLSEQMNQRMYVISIFSAIFLPLGFLTGLLGVNVGGIPGANDSFAFLVFILILLSVFGVQWWLFKKYRWL
ncbi:zinc transporter ZntB [Gynuella sunshinyii]|uniref:Mg2+ and Co2+ transporter n=1 Tax=Gynuella sunshinyii YC6258 TaxID=1445510 RepID=A0A0C5VST0_9GAMM|nr:zinc transporter ZntB [Gynuella sunshinyii]AJQ97732.1 Mg2+ and Co2+ transporter [Gynuella sunshinyii YC6258]